MIVGGVVAPFMTLMDMMTAPCADHPFGAAAIVRAMQLTWCTTGGLGHTLVPLQRVETVATGHRTLSLSIDHTLMMTG